MRGFARASVCGALLAATVGITSASASAAPDQAPPAGPTAAPSNLATATDQMIVHFAQGRSPDASTLRDLGGEEVDLSHQMGDGSWVVKLGDKYAPSDTAALARSWESEPSIAYVEPDARMFPTLTPNDSLYSQQWDMKAVSAGSNYGANLPPAWDITTGSASAITAVLDTGYLDHADLAGRFLAGYDMINEAQVANDGNLRDADAHDPGDWITSAENSSGFFQGCGVSNSSWHGTHVSGTIGANGNNAAGVAGIAWGSKILPVRVLGKCGGYLSDIADGIRWASGLSVSGVPANPNVAKVINMSLGGSGACGTTYQSAIDAATLAGTLVVVAAGNDNDNVSNHRPGNCNNVLTVAATSQPGSRSYYSNYGAGVDIAAPGGASGTDSMILSTLNNGTTSPTSDAYVNYQGTSMATPHVAGVATLVRSVNPSLNPGQITSLLRATVTPFPGGSTCSTSLCGTGILNAGAAVAAAQIPATLRVTTSPALPADIIVDGTARDTWGLNWAAMPAGAHQVCFGDVPGYTKPPCQNPTLTQGSTSTVTGTYTQNGFLRVITSPAVPSTITVDGVPRNDWGLWAEVTPGTYNVCFGNVAGYNVPSCRDVVVGAGATGTTTGTFTANASAPGPAGAFGYLRAVTSPANSAMISVDGQWRNNWGLDWVKLSTGSHQVCWGNAPNLTTPSCQNVNIANGATATTTGSYGTKGFLRVQTSPAVAANITVDGVVANAYGMWTAKAPGTYNVCFTYVIGYTTPSCQSASVSAGTTTDITGTYAPFF
ncbi:MAG: S8 family peptidase [Actinobacteria bacterium]|nr:S8 family peptidase [Actinomycetota bacterium]